jgi:hypothetical protein
MAPTTGRCLNHPSLLNPHMIRDAKVQPFVPPNPIPQATYHEEELHFTSRDV